MTTPPTAACPRCRVALEPFQKVPARGGAASAVEAEMCPRCQGVWYDAGELAAANPALARVHEQPDEVFRSARGAPPCPRCRNAMRQFTFLAVELDYCAQCRGVWVDGTEHTALALARAQEPAEADLASGAAYRGRAAADAMFRGVVACTRCRAEVPLRESVMTGAGVMCAPCAHTHEAESGASAEGADVPSELKREWGAWTFVKETGSALGTALLGVLSVGYCPHCGRRRGTCLHG